VLSFAHISPSCPAIKSVAGGLRRCVDRKTSDMDIVFDAVESLDSLGRNLQSI
jgi:hypothetical protein